MRSQFTFKAIFFVVLSIAAVIFGMAAYFIEEMAAAEALPLIFSIVLLTFLGFVFGWLFFGEFRTKAIKVELRDTDLVIKKYGGLGPAITFSYNELDGFRTSLLTSNGGEYEYLYLLKDSRKIAKISEFYHSNYYDLKAFLEKKLTDLGFEEFSLLNEVKESFK